MQNVLFQTHPWECANTIHTDKKEKRRLYNVINYTEMYLARVNYGKSGNKKKQFSI